MKRSDYIDNSGQAGHARGWVLMALLSGTIVLLSSLAYAGHGSVMDRAKDATEPYDSTKVPGVREIPGKTVKASMDYQGGAFRVLARKGLIERFPCNKCHNDKKLDVRKDSRLAHGDIELAHGQGDNSPTCKVCHDPKERNFLHDKQDRKIDFDHSYQLCGQCHFRQKIDWIGGAHGKRVSYWAGKRVVRNCTTCHDPHSPRFKKRWPKTYSLPLDE